jgi:sec-independent protein translocase protein TatA
MLGNIGPLEIGIVLVVALLVFGPQRLPELGSGLGRGIRDFKSGLEGHHEEDEDQTAIATSESTVAAPKVVEK